MNKLDKKYTALLQDILDNGVKKGDRTGTGTISVFGRQIRHDMKEGFPLLTTKKMHWKSIVTELLWFLSGNTNIQYLIQNGCHIWDGDAYKNFQKSYVGKDGNIILPPDDYINDDGELLTQEEFINKIKTDDDFAKKWGELGPIYGSQWRNWKGFKQGWNSMADTEYPYEFDTKGIDQITEAISKLKTNPDDRGIIVSAWNVGELDQMVLRPCHNFFQFYTRELSWEERFEYSHNVRGLYYLNRTREQIEEDLNYENIPTRAISLMWNQRSVDTFLGLPFNIASYGLLLEIIAKEVNMIPDELIGNLGDVHLYSNHIEQAKEQIGRELTIEERTSLYRKQQNLSDDVDFVGTDRDAHSVFDDYGITKRTREPFPLPRLKIKQSINTEPGILLKPEFWHSDDFIIENYQSHPTIKAPLSN
jgi:thymidylate synthase